VQGEQLLLCRGCRRDEHEVTRSLGARQTVVHRCIGYPQSRRPPWRTVFARAHDRGMFSTVLDLLFPAPCAGCGGMKGPLCPSCAQALERPRTHRPLPSPVDLPLVWAAGTYQGAVRNAILAYKERGRRDLAEALGRALAGAIRPLAGSNRPLSLVPIPSRRQAARQRGGDHVLRLARVAARRLAVLGHPVTVEPLLAVVGRPLDSAGLTACERVVNLAGAFGPRGDVRLQGAVVLVDDIVTSGATLATASRVLGTHGVSVAAAAVVAATLRRGHPWGRAGGAAASGRTGVRAASGPPRSPPVMPRSCICCTRRLI
jgi:predicted amidophosphoribosyltransferase